MGLTRGSTKAHIARAALEGISYQVKDLLNAMEKDCGEELSALRVDGGASVNNFLLQFQSDILGKPIDRPKMVETTAFGAAFLAGLATGVWSDISEISSLRRSDRVFVPEMDSDEAQRLYAKWLKAVERAAKWED